MRTAFISLVIEQKLKDELDILKKLEGHSITYHLEKALENYLKIKLHSRLDYINKK